MILDERPETLSAARIHDRSIEKPVFSASEVGRATIVREALQAMTGYDYSLPLENQTPAEIYDLYHAFSELDFLPVRNESGWITGYLTRQKFLAALSESQYSRDLLFRKEARIHQLINRNIVCLNAHTHLSEASEILMRRPDYMRFDPFVVTLDRQFFGISTVDRVIRSINYFLQRDMDAVRDAQEQILKTPCIPSEVEIELSHHVHVQPLQGPGGDFAKVYEINDRFALAMLFDVCGKGVKAAAMVTVLGTLLETMWEELHKHPSFSLRILENELYRLNNKLVKLSSPEMYATGVVFLIDKQNYILSVFDYGHGMTWLRRNHRVHELQNPRSSPSMPFIGIYENLRLNPFSFRIKSGDLLLTCSDGIIEQVNYDRQMYGAARVREAFQIAPVDPPSETCRYILDDWKEFCGHARIRDDFSLLVIGID
jgi:serine phosphatase RsbU (regulator of sigma subunit)